VVDQIGKQGWRRVKFGDVVVQSKEKADPEASGLERYVAGEHMATDDLRIRQWGQVGSGYLGPAFHMRFRPGQVLYGSRRTYLRKVAVAEFDGICANTTFVLESKDTNRLLQQYLPYIMQTTRFHEFSIKHSKGSVNPYINFSDLADYEFDLPPLAEQVQISERLAVVLHMGEELREARLAAANAYERMTLDFFAPQKDKYHDSDPTSLFPTSWKHYSFGEICVPDAPICYGIVQVLDHVEDGIPTVAIKDLSGDFGTGLHRTSKAIEAGYERSRIKSGDLLISVKAVIGEVALVPSGFEGNISRDLARVRLSPDFADGNFCLHLIRSAPYRRYISKYIVGSTRDELSIGTLRKLILPLPSLEEQRFLAGALQDASAAIDKIDSRILQAEFIKQRLIGELI